MTEEGKRLSLRLHKLSKTLYEAENHKLRVRSGASVAIANKWKSMDTDVCVVEGANTNLLGQRENGRL